ncbi:MAG: M16 family metallopeptidase [Ilumatobacteraceae bacterium]
MTERVVVLDNGLTVAVDPMETTRSVSVGVWVGVGSRDEPEPIAGVSHFLEHLLFKGTSKRSASDISRSVDRVGGDINAYTARENTTFYCRMPARNVNDAISLLGDVISNPSLRASDVESERQVILEELAMDDESPDDVAHRVFAEQLFIDHSLGRDPGGTRQSVSSIAPDDIRRFHSEHYAADRMVVAIAGAVDPGEVISDVASAFSTIPSCGLALSRTMPTNSAGDRSVHDDTEQTHLVIGGLGLSRVDPRRECLDVVNHALGGGLSSRLFDEIRERRGLVYTVFSGLSSFSDIGAWSVYAATNPERTAEVHDLIVGIIDDMAKRGPTEEEIETSIGYLVGAFEMSLEDSGARMARLGGMLSTSSELRPVDEQIARWRRVTQSEAADVAANLLNSGRLTVSVGRS